ncbi:unnamed protein product, partial [Didymodactylos carnosus]
MDITAILAALATAGGYVSQGATVIQYLKWIYDNDNTINMIYSKDGKRITFTAEETPYRDLLTEPPGVQKYAYAVKGRRKLCFKVIEIDNSNGKCDKLLEQISTRFAARPSAVTQLEILSFLTHMIEEYYPDQVTSSTTQLGSR